MDINTETPEIIKKKNYAWVFDLLFVVILLIGAYFRFTGLDWDEGTYLHPDERFLAMVETSLESVGSFGEYWDTQVSSMNPNNRGHGFFVYGTLPIFFVRYFMEAVGKVGYSDVAVYGRPLAGIFDLLTVFMLYLAASKLYNRRVALLAAAFSSFAVLQIQLSHFYTVDIFANFFIWFAVYVGARIIKTPPVQTVDGMPVDGGRAEELVAILRTVIRHPLLAPMVLFGLLTGAAAASKISAFPVAFLLPLTAWVFISQHAPRQRNTVSVPVVVLLTIAGVGAALAFRIFQPYAFAGPGFFGVSPNMTWLESIGRLQDLVEPSSGFPPSVQWFNRPIWFSAQNLVLWGLGLPLGLLAWSGFAWMGYRMFKGDWQVHVLVWAWVGFHFAWQSAVPNPTMRYQLPIYPGLALMAGWFLVDIWDRASGSGALRRFRKGLVLAIGMAVLAATFVYAAAFTNIYRTEVTRIAASRWIYQNLPGAINLHIQGAGGETNQLLPYPKGYLIRPGEPYSTVFVALESGEISEITVPHLEPGLDERNEGGLYLGLYDDPESGVQLVSSLVNVNFAEPGDTLIFDFGQLVPLAARTTYTLRLDLIGNTGVLHLCEPINLLYLADSGPTELILQPPADCSLSASTNYEITFTPEQSGVIPNVLLSQPLNYEANLPEQTIAIAIGGGEDGAPVVGAALPVVGPAEDLVFSLSEPLRVEAGRTYVLQASVESGSPITLFGSVIAQETSWDDALPMRLDGYDGFGGIYQGDNNMELYWEDAPDKVDRITGILDRVDVVQISSSRQWGSLTRLPDRWPVVDRYYRLLLGCPEDRTVEWCYNVAQPGMFEGQLGFELVEVFQSNPKLGFIEINDQASEEAFTVYDHPKVFILLKTDAYDPARIRALFADVTYAGQSGQAGPQEPQKSLLLSEEARERQRNAGTWSELFSTDSLLNRFQPLTVIVWYLVVFFVGLAVYPLLRNILPGLEDRGYPLSRAAGMLLVSYLAWVSGSAGVAVTRAFLSWLVLAVAIAGGFVAFRQRGEILTEWRLKRKYFVTIEALAALLFLFVLFIRMANPDLWHPWKGGEKPMDFAYFNAVLRSINFPPYDPWFAGGYINYYYYGFVFVGVLVKWLGIVPSIAYNLIIPTLFMMVGLGSFSITWNLVKTSMPGLKSSLLERIRLRPLDETGESEDAAEEAKALASSGLSYSAGLASAIGVALLGNMGTLRMIVQGYQKIVAPPETVLTEVFFLTRWKWTVEGLLRMLSTNAEFPYAMADWYWNPSRAIPAPGDIEPITEFPFFTFLYSDLHAHMIAMPIALLALAWALSAALAKDGWRSLVTAAGGLLFGGLVIGALRPTNTWDFPTYLVLGGIAAFIAGWRAYGKKAADAQPSFTAWAVQAGVGAIGVLILAGLSWFLYQPYTNSYALGYTDVNIWQGSHTSLSAYLTHWGLFVFLILFWMVWETREWLAATPASAGLRFIRGHIEYILGALFLLAAGVSALLYLDVALSVYVLPLAFWAGVLIVRPGQSDQKRIVLFLIGSGLVLSLMVETVVLSGDIGRMNTVFKFYLQVWLLFGVSSAAIMGWTLSEVERWSRAWRAIWTYGLVVLVFCAALYPLLGGFAKIEDRMAEGAPVTLDGLAYMPYASYYDQGRELRLDEDYRAIRWLQENIQGTPVIVEGQVVEYRWGARFSINTGLPAVLGWNWHQRQQRTGHDLDVWDRENRVREFYTTTNVNIANRFLSDFDVAYIIIGQMEEAYYGGHGLEKFDLFNGRYWQEIYRDGETRIYRVIEQ